MKTAFKPKPVVFMHICKNCKHGKKVKYGLYGTRYVCKFDGETRLPGEACAIPFTEDDSEQITMDI